MKRIALLVPLAIAGAVLAGCGGGADGTAAPAARQDRPPASTTTSVAPTPAAFVVPKDLVGKTMGAAKRQLAKAGFSNVVVAGIGVTDADEVVSVPESGQQLALTARVRLIGAARVVPDATAAPGAGEAGSTGGSSGCGLRAVDAGQFDPTCQEYQGYLDPGTIAGRGPTSGEVQRSHGCEQGYIPESEC